MRCKAGRSSQFDRVKSDRVTFLCNNMVDELKRMKKYIDSRIYKVTLRFLPPDPNFGDMHSSISMYISRRPWKLIAHYSTLTKLLVTLITTL